MSLQAISLILLVVTAFSRADESGCASASFTPSAFSSSSSLSSSHQELYLLNAINTIYSHLEMTTAAGFAMEENIQHRLNNLSSLILQQNQLLHQEEEEAAEENPLWDFVMNYKNGPGLHKWDAYLDR